jgi:soluble lytic murein transglycosylase
MLLTGFNSAKRVAALAGRASVPWAAVIKDVARPANCSTPCPPAFGRLLLHEKSLSGPENSRAAAVMLKAPSDRDALVDPDACQLDRRRVLARGWSTRATRKPPMRSSRRMPQAPTTRWTPNYAGWYHCATWRTPARCSPLNADGPISRARAITWLAGRRKPAARARGRTLPARGRLRHDLRSARGAKVGLTSINVAYPASRIDRQPLPAASRVGHQAAGSSRISSSPRRSMRLARN